MSKENESVEDKTSVYLTETKKEKKKETIKAPEVLVKEPCCIDKIKADEHWLRHTLGLGTFQIRQLVERMETVYCE